jgi:hypothetical protein
MLKKNKVRLAAAAGIVACATVFGSFAANADPTAGTFKPLSGVGSDTIQDVMNAMAASSTITGAQASISDIASYDATNPSGVTGTTIQTKSGGNAFLRPNGSGAGINALSASIDGSAYSNGSTGTTTITGQVDFARSSSGPSAAHPGTTLTFIPFAQDAVTYAVNEASSFPRNIPSGIGGTDTTAFTLYNIYHCTVTSYTGSNGLPVTIIPLLPQQGSGTRSFWEGQFGLTDTALPACVTDLNNTVEEHNGKSLTGPGDIMPFSISQFIAQGNWQTLPVNVQERRFGAQLGAIGGVQPYTISGTTIVQNSSFPIKRLVYNVVQTSRLTDTNIAADFVGTTSALCTNTNIIKEFGFATIGSQCGSTTATSGLYQ